MSRKNRPYLFYDTTTSVCTTCLRPVEAKILIKENHVYLEKWCPAHKTERVLISDDANYYRLCREVYVKPPEMPEQFSTSMEYGCPFDCGLCPDHMQHSCVSVVEVTEQCNLSCPVCYAESAPNHGKHAFLTEVIAMLDTVVKHEGEADIVQISGGEPTIHPDFFAILDAVRERPIRHLMINTNGLRIANAPEFVQRLSQYKPGIEIYLQFDSLANPALQNLRGAHLLETHQAALEQLERYNLSTTLVMTVKQGLNDHEIGDVIQHALTWTCVRGVTLQPIQNAGRVDDFETKNRLTVSEIRRKIAEQSGLFNLDDIMPVPCNPDTLAMAYALKQGNKTFPLTRWLKPADLLAGNKNTIIFERDEALKKQLFKLFSTNLSPLKQAKYVSELLCCLPKIAGEGMNYDHVFRVLIVQFMDARNLDIRALKKSCVHIAQANGTLIPFEAFNLFYRGDRAAMTEMIRQEIAAWTQKRHTVEK
ncbi:MAG: radical SAM protein [Methylococcales bacterium]|nr:radical SAM protein [Methylococcales bacterium]